MNWIVTAGNLAASRLTKKPLNFWHLSRFILSSTGKIGDVVTVKAMVEYAGKTSLEVEAVVFCKPLNGEKKNSVPAQGCPSFPLMSMANQYR